MSYSHMKSILLSSIRLAFICAFILLPFHNVMAEDQKAPEKPAQEQKEEPKAEGSESSMEDLSLGDLLNMEITVTSDQPDRVSDAPGTVTGYTKDNIEDFGYFTIGDLAELTPGYSTIWAIADRALETRGGVATLNEKHLIRVDGIPINNVRSGTGYIQEGLPLLFVENIEFLRGPASALYGIGAFNGVVNIIPRERTENGVSVDSRFTFGTDVSKHLEEWDYIHNRDWDPVFHKQVMANAGAKGDNYVFDANVGYYDRKADMVPWDTSTGPRGGGSGPNMNSYRDIFSRVSQKMMSAAGDFTLGFLYINQHTGYGLGWANWDNKFNTTKANWHEWRTVMPYLKHDVALSDKASLNSYVKYHNGHERGTQTNSLGWWADPGTLGVFGYNICTHNWEAYTKLTVDVNKYFNIIGGFNYDIRWNSRQETWTRQSNTTELFERFYNKKSHTISQFAQIRAVAPVLADLIFTGGIRLDEGILSENKYFQPSPRAALVQRFTKNFIAKVMYGTALKAPGIQELGHNDEKLHHITTWNNANPNNQVSLPDLEPEVLHTLEANLTFVNNFMYLSGTYFNNTIQKQMERITPWDSINSDFWFNADDDAKAQGGEFEGRFALPIDMYILASFAMSQTEDLDGDPVRFLPRIKWNLGITQKFDFGLTLSAIARMTPLYSEDTTVTKPDNSTKTIGKDSTSSNVYFDLNIAQKLNDRFSLELKVNNLFDKQVPYVELNPLRSILFSIRSKF